MSNSSLVSYTNILPYKNSPRQGKIRKITIHHMAGNCTARNCIDQFLNPARASQGSCNYAIGTDGAVAMGVEEKDRSWCSRSPENDHQAITIEVANDGGAPNWHVSDVALAKLIDLCVDICKRNGIPKLIYTGDKTGNLTRHDMFANTCCPGPYLGGKFPYIASEVNKRLGVATVPEPIKATATSTFRVKIIDCALNVRKSAGTDSPVTAVIKDRGVYTIVDEEQVGTVMWGKLKSGAGWISLNEKYVKRI